MLAANRHGRASRAESSFICSAAKLMLVVDEAEEEQQHRERRQPLQLSAALTTPDRARRSHA
jgi:hypothetical protein